MKIFSPTISGSSQTSGSLTISGSLNVSQGITGSLLGTASWAINVVNGGGGGSTNTGSLLTTASVVLNTITFTKGDGSTFPITVNTGSGGGGGSVGTLAQVTALGASTTVPITASIISASSFTGSLLGTASWAQSASNVINARTASFINNLNQDLSITGAVIISGSSLPELRIIGDTQFTGSVNSLNGYTGSLLGTSSWATNALTASFAPSYLLVSQTSSFVQNSQTSSFVQNSQTSSMLAPYVLNSQTSSFVRNTQTSSMTVLSSSFASTSSFVNTLNQNVLITGSLTVGATSIGANENTLILGLPPAGGIGEGGQLLLQASGGIYTSASMLDNYQNQTRLLRGTNAGSDAIVALWNMHSKQMQLPAYNSPTAFTATVLAGLLGFDANGNIITTTTSSGGGGGGVTILNNTDNYLITATGTANTLNGESNLQFNGSSLTITGNITASGTITAQANGQMYFRGGDDAELWDINVANTLGVYGQQDQGIASIKLGSGGGVISGRSGSIGIGITTPNSGALHVSGGVFATSFTGSLLGTSSWATNALTASFAPNYLLVSQTSSFVQNSQTSSFVQNSQTSSMLAPYVLNSQTSSFVQNSQTSSFVQNSQTSSFVQNSQTSSMLAPYVLTSVTSSMLAPYVLTSVTSSMLAPYTLNSQTSSFVRNTQTSSMTVLSSSFAATASFAPSYLLVSQTSSFVQNSQTSSMTVLSSSFASTSSLANRNILTASVSLNTITFTKGDGSTFPITVNTGSGGGGGGSDFPYTGSAIISGSLIVTGSTNSSGGFTGSLFGTASHAITASYALSSAGGGGGSFSLAGATDVSFSALADGDLIRYNGIAGKWQNTNLGLSLTPSLSAIEGGYFGGYVKITNWGSYSQPVAQAFIKSGSSTIITCSVDTSGQITWSDSNTNYNFTRSLSVQIQDFGDIASEIVTASYVKQTASFRYYRWFAVSASSHVLINDFRFYSGSAQTSTAFPANMTNSGSPAPYVASASGFYVGYPAWQAFDSSTTTQWWNLSAPPYQGAFVSIDMGSTFTSSLRSMRIQFGQSFQDFTVANIQGSNDNTTWTTIHTITNVPSANNSLARNFG